MENTISCPHSTSRYTWKIRGKRGLSFELDVWAGRKRWEASASQREREREQNTPDRGNEAGRESKSQEIKTSWGWTLLRAVSSGTGRAGCGPLGLLPESRGGRTQICILEASWCMSCKDTSGTGRMGRGRLHICMKSMTKGMKTESLLHATCSITL